ncbi:uncharacterized protein LOC118433638 isoform X2 [Folsomia candida]|uniref:uncharacterized protein LOC118433638 isoform X2 n=1 Tax=Folsomia candida TaxID=158441 RepID=UPI0016053E0F|nr:uncharacterized protein LOC118433638 isoform X2 [Folsomia candida]
MTSQLVSGNNTNDPRHLTQKQTLKKDDTLVYSCSDIKREIEQTLINFQSPAYCQPRHGQLYRLANAIYYPEKILLQDKEPLKLITTVHNNAKSNQYHGALFLNAKTSQIIIVNKGTDSLGSFWADIRAVVNGNLDNSHILSAITFALKVRDVVEELGGILQINVTGHSLGGFLSTLQAFAMEWLQFEENEIQARAIHTYRVHVVGFESPGSKDFLTKLWSNFFKEERYVNNKILECLDLTNYTTDPNAINTYGLHLGTMYSFSPAFYDLAGCYKINLRNINAHSVANFETLFDEEENIQQNANLRQILDHPLTTIMSGGELHKLQHRRMVNISPEEVLKWRRLTAFTPQVKQFLEAFELVRDLNVIKNDVLPPEIMGMLQSYVVTIGNGGFNGVQLTTQNVTTDQFVAEVDMSMRKNPHFIPQQLNAMKNCAKEWVRNLGFTTAAYFQGEVTDFNITEQTHIKYFQVEKLERKTNISVIDLLVGVNVVAKILKNKKSYQIFRVGDLVAAEFDYQRHITTDVAILTCMDDDEIYNAGKIADGIGVKVIIISQNRDGIALKWDDLQKKSQNKIMNMEVNLQGKTMLVSDLHIPVVMELLNNLLKKESTVFHLPPIGPLPEYFVEGRIAESRNSMGCVPQSPMQLQFSASVNELSDKILIITGTSGQGKSAFLTNLVTNQPRDGNITLFLQLRKVIPELKLLKTKLITMTQDDAVDFIANSIKLDEIERTILSQSLISVNGPRLNFFVDGFDEVCPDYEETLLKLFQILNKSTMKRMWISTNYHFEEKLVHTLECPSYKVLPLSVDSATALLSNRLNDLVKGWVGTPQQISLCQSWLAISQQWTNDGSMTTPLLILLLADHVAPIAKEFVSGEDITSLSPLKINIIQLFDSVFGEKLKITKDKMNIPVDGSVGTSEILEASVRDQHEFLALKELGVLENADLNRAFPRMSAKLDPQLISRQGIFYHDGSSYYSVHRAFAEYLAGSYLSKDLRVEDIDEIAEAVQIAIVREVAQPRYLQLLKKVINEELKEMGSIPVEKFKSYGESFIREMNKNWSEGCTFTHRINQDGNANILEFVLKSVKMLSDGVDTLKNFLGSRCGFQQSPMQDTQSAEIVNVMFKYADCLGMDEKKRILFGLGEDNFSYLSSFSVIVGRDEAFTALVGQTRGVLEDEEVSHLFFSEDKWGSTLLWSSVWANVRVKFPF